MAVVVILLKTKNMKKYKLINKQTGEEHICEKVVVGGWDYYVSDNYINKLKPDDAYHTIVENPRRVVRYTKYIKDTTSGVIICGTNPNIDVPKVVDEVEMLAYEHCDTVIPKDVTRSLHYSFKCGYNKSQETHPFSEEDMIDFANFLFTDCAENGPFGFSYKGNSYSNKELLQIWKEQQPKIVYYE